MLYQVQFGDSPATIARRFGVPFTALIGANPQKPTTIVAGMHTFSTLVPGETLNVPVGGYVGATTTGNPLADALRAIQSSGAHVAPGSESSIVDVLKNIRVHHGERGIADAVNRIKYHVTFDGGWVPPHADAAIANAVRHVQGHMQAGLLGNVGDIFHDIMSRVLAAKRALGRVDLAILSPTALAAKGWHRAEGGTFVNRHGIHADRWGRPVGHGPKSAAHLAPKPHPAHPQARTAAAMRLAASRVAAAHGVHGLSDAGFLGDAGTDAVNALLAAGDPCDAANVALVCAAQGAMGLGVDGKWGGGTASAAQALVPSAPGGCTPRPSWWAPAGQVNCPSAAPTPAPSAPPSSQTLDAAAAAAFAALSTDSHYCVTVGQVGSAVNSAVHNFKAAWNASNPGNAVPIGTGQYELSVAAALSSALGGQTAPPGCTAARVPVGPPAPPPPPPAPPSPPPAPPSPPPAPPSPPPAPPSPPPTPPSPPPAPPSPPPAPPSPPPLPLPGGQLWSGGPPAGLAPAAYVQWAITHPGDVTHLITLGLLPAGWMPIAPSGRCLTGQVWNPLTQQCEGTTVSCPPGTALNPMTGQCTPLAMPPAPPQPAPPTPTPPAPGPVVVTPAPGGLSTGAIVAGAVGAVALVGIIAAASMSGKGGEHEKTTTHRTVTRRAPARKPARRAAHKHKGKGKKKGKRR